MIRDYSRVVDPDKGLVIRYLIVYARRSDYLADNNSLCAVDNKGTAVCHELEIAHVYLLLLDLFRLLVLKTDSDLQRCGV